MPAHNVVAAQYVIHGSRDYVDVGYNDINYVVDSVEDDSSCESCRVWDAFSRAAYVAEVISNKEVVAEMYDRCDKLRTCWFSSRASYTSYAVTEYDVSEIRHNLNVMASLASVVPDICPCDLFVDLNGVFPLYGLDTLQHLLFNVDYPENASTMVVPTMVRIMQEMRAGDTVVQACIRHIPEWEHVDKIGPSRFVSMQESMSDHEFLRALFPANEDEKSLTVTTMSVLLVQRPLRGWARARHVLRMRSIIIYWLFLTEHSMGPGGEARKRDRKAFESEF